MEFATDRNGNKPSRTKIVATLGPATDSLQAIQQLILAGADVFRLNMAHGSIERHEQVLANVRQASQVLDQPIAVLVDLGGPKIRLGQLAADVIECRLGDEFRFVRGQTSRHPDELVTSYASLVDELKPGDRIMLADGTVGLKVTACEPDQVICQVTRAGRVRSRQGVNLPGAKLKTSPMTPEDETHALWAISQEVDFLGLSFVRSPGDVQQLKSWLDKRGSKAQVIAKIEKPEALDHLAEIVGLADAIMVARGDLGVEVDVAEVPMLQKRIIAVCRRYHKPVITATQMLESMQQSPQPTRAEASDIANAIIDGTDACMLSGETAIGKFPAAAVETMSRIARVTESQSGVLPPAAPPLARINGLKPATEAVVRGASVMAAELHAKLIAVVSRSGATVLAFSKQRNKMRTLGISDSPLALRRMALYWGVTPLATSHVGSTPRFIELVEAWGRQAELLSAGDYFILVDSTPALGTGHNLVTIHQVH